eukprot:GHVT01045416.1.p1 GENE.GHVT01045416.1~~GHVT01045416.1.p1  ORF type:complete len:667 (-),score=32.39 GHVT01045416.1:1618-3618(-)
MFSYKFSNLCSAPFTGGRTAFSPEGKRLFSPVANRLCCNDLTLNRCFTFPFENRRDIHLVCLHPSGKLAITIDVGGHACIINLISGSVLHRIQFKNRSAVPTSTSVRSSLPQSDFTNHVADAAFSPDGRHFAVAVGRKLQIWDSPCLDLGWHMNLRKTWTGHLNKIHSIDWSPNSQYLVTASSDMTVRLWGAPTVAEECPPLGFVDHRYPVRGAFFTNDMRRIVSVASDGTIISWLWKPDEVLLDAAPASANAAKDLRTRWVRPPGGSGNDCLGKDADSQSNGVLGDGECFGHKFEADKPINYRRGVWTREIKAFCNQTKNSTVASVAFHRDSNLLTVGFTGGVFTLYESPEFHTLYSLSVSGADVIDSISVNSTGEWLALGCAESGQLLVWEWRSETYVLKQQGHHFGIRCVSFSPAGSDTIRLGAQAATDGKGTRSTQGSLGTENSLGLGSRNIVATGGFDGKVKLWDTLSGFCFVTFTDHKAAVMEIVFTPQANVFLSASLDGTVRAYDLLRYRNFRTFSSPEEGVQFVCAAVDGGGEVVVAGCQGSEYSVFVWSIQTGRLLDKLAGHEAPVSGVAFHPHPSKPGVLASASWDTTLRVWDIYGRGNKGGSATPLVHTADVLAMAFDPRANSQLAASTLSGRITFWDIDSSEVQSFILSLTLIG